MTKYRFLIAVTLTLAVFSPLVTAIDITDTYADGDTLTATSMNNIKAAVNSKLDDSTDSVTAGHIAADAVGAAEIATGAVGAAEIATGAVGASELATNAVTSGDTLNEPGLEFFQETDVGTIFNVSNTWTAIRTLSVTAPSSGFVTCIATGHIVVTDIASTSQVNVGWDINNTTSVVPDSFTRYQLDGITSVGLGPYIPLSAMHSYSVATGVSTFSLKIHTPSTDATDFDVRIPSFACMFFPTRY